MNTKFTIGRIDPSSTAKVISLTIGILVAVVILLHFLAVAVGFRSIPAIPLKTVDASLWVIAIVPLIYMIGSYILTFAFCLAFNSASRLFGGIRIQFSD